MSTTIRLADLFAGAGGTSTGAVEAIEALGYRPDLHAFNHNVTACDTNRRNHPEFSEQVRCADLDTANPRHYFNPGDLDALWASPECRFHSPGNNGREINEQSRSTAMCTVRWLEALRPNFFWVENVPQFEDWGPIGSNRKPIQSRKGEIFHAWTRMIEAVGYRLDWRVFCCADYGSPTTRRRLIVHGVRGRRRIVWPNPTHAPSTECNELFGTLRPWRTARDSVIDWSLKGRSIFDRKRPLSPKTIARIMRGLSEMGLRPFILGSSNGGVIDSIDAPVRTICTERGGAFSLVEPCLLPQGGGGALRPVSQPVPTVATDGAIALIEPLLVKYYGTGICKPVSLPVDAVTTKARFGLCEPIVTPDGRRLVDIRYRMLSVRELARAQGFPDSYVFSGEKQEDVSRQIGNAVPRHLARALVTAALSQNPDVSWLAERDEAETHAVLN